jgi:hypothetical protein
VVCSDRNQITAAKSEHRLQLLDLQHLEPQLVASTLQVHEPSSQFKQSPVLSPSSSHDHAVPLDGEGWQIPHLSSLDAIQDDEERQDHEWSIASSKRQKRRKRAPAGSLHTSPSATDMTRSTTTTTIATTISSPDESRNDSMEDLASSNGIGGRAAGNSKVYLKEERKRRKKEKKKLKQQGHNVNCNGGMEASGILMPSSEVLKDEDWVEAEDSRSKEHRDEAQVALDINRSFIGEWKGDEKRLRREQLSRVIIGVLRRHDGLNYYQGYHDIISILLIVLIPQADGIADMDKALEVVIEVASRVSLHLIRDNMTVNMEPSMGHLKVLRNLLRDVDHSMSVEVEAASSLPYFALPWLISLFAHELDYRLSILVFDYILARSPSSVIYLAVALIVHAKTDSSNEDAAEKHHSFSQLPSRITAESLPSILQQADLLSEKHPLNLGTIMGSRSVLVTWHQLAIASHKVTIATPWPHADALAEAILIGGTEQIVIDSLPTPPASDDGFVEKEHDKRRHRKSRHSATSPLLAVAGAVGAVGLAALLMYGAGKTGVTL